MDENIETLLQALTEGDEARRIEAAQALACLEESSENIVRALESAVVSDPSRAVQEAALAALAAPVHHQLHRQLMHTFGIESRQTIIFHIDQWAADGLLTPELTAVLKGRYAPDPPRPPKPEAVVLPQKRETEIPPQRPEVVIPPLKPERPIPPPKRETALPVQRPEVALPPLKPERVIPREPAAPKEPIKEKEELSEGEITAEGDAVVDLPFLEKQKFSLIGTFTSETTIKIALYLGAFLIVSAAVIFAGLVEPARFPMLTLTLLGFLTSSRVTIQRLPLGSFVLFVIGTLLIPIDAAVFFALINTHASLVYWAVVTAGMSLVWAWGTYTYHSRALSLVVFATLSIAVYLVAASFLAIESAGFLLVVSLVALAGLGEAELLRRWQGESFFEPMFAVVQLQALLILGILGGTLLSQVNDVLAAIDKERHLSGLDSHSAALLGGWLLLGTFYFASGRLTRHWKHWEFPIFPLLVTVCLMTPPVFIMEALSVDSHRIAAVLWGWGALVTVAAEVLHAVLTRWVRPYALFVFYAALSFLTAAPLVEYVIILKHAAGYFLGTGLIFFALTYRRKLPTMWSLALLAVYLGYLVGAKALGGEETRAPVTGETSVSMGFALLVPALVFLSVELMGRRYFRASTNWTTQPLLLGLFNLVWDAGIVLSWYGDHPGHAALILVIYGLFGALYATLDDQRDRGQATIGWTAGLIAGYVAYIYLLPNVKQIDFGGYVLLAPALVFLSAELFGKRYAHAGPSWTWPLLGLGLLNAALGILATLIGGVTGHPGSAAMVFLLYGLFGALYAVLDMPSEREFGITAWTAGLIALYVAYGFIYLLPAIDDLDIFPGFAFLIPALICLLAELAGKLYFRLSRDWTLPLFGLGLLNAALVIPVTLTGGLDHAPGGAVFTFLIYGLFGILYAALDAQYERDHALTAWTIGLIALYVAYVFIYRLSAIKNLDIFSGFALLIPMLVFLSAELAGKLYLKFSRDWTLPLFELGLLNAALTVMFAFEGGFHEVPGSAAIIFLAGGLFAVLYAALDARAERNYAIIAWPTGLIALYAAYGFVCLEYLDIFPGFALLVPAIIFLSAELAGKLYFKFSRDWTLPLFGLGLRNAALVILVTLDGGLDSHAGSAAGIFLIYGLFGIVYAALDAPYERDYAIIAWTISLIALYVAYGFVYLLPALEHEDSFPGYALLIPALVFLSAELAGKLRFKFSRAWTLPLFGLGLLNAVPAFMVALGVGLDNHPGRAAIIFLVGGLFAVLYAALDARAERDYAIIAWPVGLIAFYAAYGFVSLEYLDISPGFALLAPAIVFLSAELAGKIYFGFGRAWTLPMFGLGLLNAALVIPAALYSGLDHHPGSAAIIFLVYGLFGIVYAALVAPYERDYAITAWTVGLIALYVAYGFVYLLPALERGDYFSGYALLVPALVFLTGELAGKLYFQFNRAWTLPLFGLGLLNAALVVPAALYSGLDSHPGSAAIIFLVYGLFGVLYAVLTMPSEREVAVVAWTVGLVALYAAYGFVYLEYLNIFLGYALLAPALVFLSAELAGKLYYRVSRDWTLPLFGLGLLNAALVVPVALYSGLDQASGSAATTFLIYGLFGILYAAFDALHERDYALTAWTVGLIALYVAYGFVYLLPALEREDYFAGYALLVPAIVCLLAELAGRRYYQVSPPWTNPLFGLGLLNAALGIPITINGGLNDYPGSAAIIFLVYGLFIILYGVLDRRSELGYAVTISPTVALGFALRFYDQQDQWVLPFAVLAVTYYLGALVVSYFDHRGNWFQGLYWSGLAIGTATALSAPTQGGGGAVVGMAMIATLYGMEAFRRQNVWLGMPANGLFLGAYLMALLELNVTEPQFYSVGTGLLAIVTHYLMVRRSEQPEAFVVGFAMGVTAQVILLGTSFYQMSAGLQQFFFLLFFQSLILLAYGLVIHSLCFTIIPILFVVGGVLRVVFTLLASYSTVLIIGGTGLALVLLGITALVMRERLLRTYEEFRQTEDEEDVP